MARGAGYAAYVSGAAAQVLLLKNTTTAPAAIGMRFLGGNLNTAGQGEQLLPGTVNYFTGKDSSKWRTNIPTYSRTRFQNIYPGVDLVYYESQRNLEFDLVVAPGADYHKIRLAFTGALHLTPDGSLAVSSAGGSLTLHRPVVYQEEDGRRRTIPARIVQQPDGAIGFRIAHYNHAQPLIIDPVLDYATYLGGPSDASAFAIAVDSAGNAYLTGITGSGFPVTPGAFQTTRGAGPTPFIAKINPSGSALLYVTYLGGPSPTAPYNESDSLVAIAVDATGAAYVAGSSNSIDFPTTPGVLFPLPTGNDEEDPILSAIIAKLDPTGSKLVYATFLGGSGSGYPYFAGDAATAIAVDNAGDAYVTGITASPGFPVTKGAYQTSFPTKTVDLPANSAFLSKLNSTATALVYSTFLSGNGRDGTTSLALDASRNAYVAGYTDSTDFPVSPGAFQSQCPNTNLCGFVSKLDPTASHLLYSTYLGGNGSEVINALALDASDNAYVTGQTSSTNFPVTPGAFQTSPPRPVFVSKLNSTGTALIYSTYLDGTKTNQSYPRDLSSSLAVDSAGDAYVLGYTGTYDFPVTADALQPAANGGNFLTKLNPAGSGLLYSSYVTGAVFQSLALDNSGNAYLAGTAYGNTLTTTPNAVQKTNRNTTGWLENVALERIDFSTAAANISVLSQPSGQSFTLAGAGCPTGVLKTPYTATWTGPCTLTWISPNLSTPGTRLTFQSWDDGDTANSRLLFPNSGSASNPFVANFLTEYLLTTSVNAPGTGQITPPPSSSNWFPAGSTAVVTATPNPGYVFAGFTGALSGETTPSNLVMNGPQSVEALFWPTPVAAQSAAVTAKSGPSTARKWIISVSNNGPGTAYDAHLAGLMFTQTFGAACTKLPVRTAPLLPLSLGNIKAGKQVTIPITLDFSGCPANARFTVTIGEVANDGSTLDFNQLVNQFQ